MPTLPMFPLGTVLLPQQVLPLQVFEPRYHALLHDVLAGDGEFGVVLIRRGHEVGGGDERHDVGTVARVVEARQLPGGRRLVVAVGSRRLRVERWLPGAPYPHAEVTALPDEPPGAAAVARRDALLPRLRRVLALGLELGEPGVPPTVELGDDPGLSCWQAVTVAPLGPHDLQRLLEVDGWEPRLRLLEQFLGDLEAALQWRLGPAS